MKSEISDIFELSQFLTEDRLSRFDEVISKRTSNVRILLENVQNYHNVSAVIRSADAFGLQHVHLIGSQFEYSRGITMGSERWVTLHQHKTTEEALILLKDLGYKLVVLQPEDFEVNGLPIKSIPVFDLPFQEKLVLVFGNERDGVSQELASKSDLHAFIPMFGFVDSLNISVAAAITMFCSSISGTKSERTVKLLNDADKEGLRADWLKTGVRNSHIILKEIQNRKRT